MYLISYKNEVGEWKKISMRDLDEKLTDNYFKISTPS